MNGGAGLVAVGDGNVGPPVVLAGADEVATPAGLRRVGGVVAAEREKEEPRGCVALFHTGVGIGGGPGLGGVERAERTGGADVLVDPGAAGERFVAAEVHAAEGGLAFVATGLAVGEDVEEAGKLRADVVHERVLIGDVVDTEFGCEGGETVGTAVGFDAPEGLGEVGLAAPDREVEGSIGGAGVDALDDPA